MTAMMGNLEVANQLSKNSAFVLEGKKSPHFQKMIEGMSEIAHRSNHLTAAQLKQLGKNKKELFVAQVINSIEDVEDLDTVNRDTVEMGAILSKHRDTLLGGDLSIGTSFAMPVVDVLRDAVYGGTTGLRMNEDGTRDHTAKRTHVASDNKRLVKLANMSFDDKRRAINVADVIDKSDSEDPFKQWAVNERKLEEARKAREDSYASTSGKVTNSAEVASDVNWSAFL